MDIYGIEIVFDLANDSVRSLYQNLYRDRVSDLYRYMLSDRMDIWYRDQKWMLSRIVRHTSVVQKCSFFVKYTTLEPEGQFCLMDQTFVA